MGVGQSQRGKITAISFPFHFTWTCLIVVCSVLKVKAFYFLCRYYCIFLYLLWRLFLLSCLGIVIRCSCSCLKPHYFKITSWITVIFSYLSIVMLILCSRLVLLCAHVLLEGSFWKWNKEISITNKSCGWVTCMLLNVFGPHSYIFKPTSSVMGILGFIPYLAFLAHQFLLCSFPCNLPHLLWQKYSKIKIFISYKKPTCC